MFHAAAPDRVPMEWSNEEPEDMAELRSRFNSLVESVTVTDEELLQWH